jgi:hypothetical protein
VSTAGECKNCGTLLAGRYCSACGQSADVRIPSVGALLFDVLGDVFSFDSRIWHSLTTLALKPGRLTSSYLEGQRARYTPPFRMYIVASLAFFLLYSLLSPTRPPPQSAADSIVEVAEGAAATARAAPAPPPAPETTEDTAATTADDGVHITLDDDGSVSCNLVDKDLPPGMRQRLVDACLRMESDNGASFGRVFADNVSGMLIVFIVIVSGIMRVLYLFARRKYVEHLLFFAHVHTLFFMLAFATLLVWEAERLAPILVWPGRIVVFAAAVYFLVYLYLAMRHVYAQGHALTAVKYVVLGVSYVTAFALTLFGTAIVSVAMA